MSAEKTAKIQRGRPFQPGKSGNPGGRPKGAGNKITSSMKEAFSAASADVGHVIVERALAGEPWACKIIADREAPALRSVDLTTGGDKFPPAPTLAVLMQKDDQ